MTRARHSILTMMKDEGPRILEWLAYHRLIGFDAIWVYSNDCRDGSDALLDRLQAMGLCRHLRNVVPADKKPQPHALTLGQKNAELLATDWLMVMDADEFLHIKTGDGTLPALLAACPKGTAGVAATWRVMGSNGIAEWSDAPLLAQFTQGACDDFRRGWGVKTLFRPFEDLKLGIHRPSVKQSPRNADRMARQKAMAWVNGSGVPLPPSFMEGGWRCSAATLGYGLAEVAHFAVQSREAYLMRADRGNVNLKADKYDTPYFAIFDRNEVAHPGLSAWAGRVADQVAQWLEDADLAQCHAETVSWHGTRLAELRAMADWSAKMDALRTAHETADDDLSDLFLSQPFPPKGRRMIDDMLARGMPEAQVARMVRKTVEQSEAARDARDAAELRAMGITPACMI